MNRLVSSVFRGLDNYVGGLGWMALVLNARGDRRLISNLVSVLKWYFEDVLIHRITHQTESLGFISCVHVGKWFVCQDLKKRMLNQTPVIAG